MSRATQFIAVIAFIGLLVLPLTKTDAQTNRSEKIKVGVATILSGDLAVLGDNAQKTVETYRQHFLRHPIEFVSEDAKKGSSDGLRAFQSLINLRHVQMIIGPMTSNGIIAGAELLNSSKTVLMTPSTGGTNIDKAGPYIFRIGNSDRLNGIQQADLFKARGLLKVALLTEETEYTTDIANSFRQHFREIGGEVVYDQSFLPDSSDFRSQIAGMLNSRPEAIFVSTQTGQAFGVFVKQLRTIQPNPNFEIHTNFVAASNPDAFTAAGTAINGVYYMEPSFEHNNAALKTFLDAFKSDHNCTPPVPFQAAGIVDSLNLLQAYLDDHAEYEAADFQSWLLHNVRNYHGLMGVYSFDTDGNTDVGFAPARI